MMGLVCLSACLPVCPGLDVTRAVFSLFAFGPSQQDTQGKARTKCGRVVGHGWMDGQASGPSVGCRYLSSE
jgi:hypothetical protein